MVLTKSQTSPQKPAASPATARARVMKGGAAAATTKKAAAAAVSNHTIRKKPSCNHAASPVHVVAAPVSNVCRHKATRRRLSQQFGADSWISTLSDFDLGTFDFWSIGLSVQETFVDDNGVLEAVAASMPALPQGHKEVFKIQVSPAPEGEMWYHGVIERAEFLGSVPMQDVWDLRAEVLDVDADELD